jgi:hypothetical protein
MNGISIVLKPRSKEEYMHWMRRCVTHCENKKIGNKYSNHTKPMYVHEDICQTLWNNHCEQYLQSKEAVELIREFEEDEG